MTWYEIHTFADDLEKIEAALYKIGAYNDELHILGLGHVIRRLDLKDFISRLDNFSAKLAYCIRVAPIIDKSISDRLDALLKDSKIEDLLVQLAVRIKIVENERRKPLAQSMKSFAYFFLQLFTTAVIKKSLSFPTDDSISLESVISSISRLRTLVKLLSEQHYNRTSNDDEIFKPSNINISVVVNQIDTAIEHLTVSTCIRPDEKEKLVAYLQEAKAELANDAPAWKKVIGALIICATLLSGLADAPQAIQNINNAIKHILGTSVEKSMPSLLPAPLPPAQQEQPIDKPNAIET